MKRNLTDKEASESYGPSVAWFRRKRWEGGGPKFIKLPGMVLYPVEELDSYFASRLRCSTSDPGTAGKALPEGKQAAKIRRIGKSKETPSAGLSSSEKGMGGMEQ